LNFVSKVKQLIKPKKIKSEPQQIKSINSFFSNNKKKKNIKNKRTTLRRGKTKMGNINCLNEREMKVCSRKNSSRGIID